MRRNYRIIAFALLILLNVSMVAQTSKKKSAQQKSSSTGTTEKGPVVAPPTLEETREYILSFFRSEYPETQIIDDSIVFSFSSKEVIKNGFGDIYAKYTETVTVAIDIKFVNFALIDKNGTSFITFVPKLGHEWKGDIRRKGRRPQSGKIINDTFELNGEKNEFRPNLPSGDLEKLKRAFIHWGKLLGNVNKELQF